MAAIGPATSLWWARLVQLVMGLGMSGVFIPAQTAAFATISNEDMATRRCCSTLCASSAARRLAAAQGPA